MLGESSPSRENEKRYAVANFGGGTSGSGNNIKICSRVEAALQVEREVRLAVEAGLLCVTKSPFLNKSFSHDRPKRHRCDAMMVTKTYIESNMQQKQLKHIY